MIFSTHTLTGGLSIPSLRTSAARAENLAELKRARASLCSRIYRSSEAGKEGAKGTATALEARMERRVTRKSNQPHVHVSLKGYMPGSAPT